jgi:hypothetical protein
LKRISEILGEFPRGIIVKAFELLSTENPILNGAVLVKSKLIHKAGGFRQDISHGEDHDLWLKLALFTQMACTDEVVLLRRRHSGALSENQEAFYKAGPLILSDIKKAYHELLIQQRIDIRKHIINARYKLAYFYYLRRMPLKTGIAAARWAWNYLGYHLAPK